MYHLACSATCHIQHLLGLAPGVHVVPGMCLAQAAHNPGLVWALQYMQR